MLDLISYTTVLYKSLGSRLHHSPDASTFPRFKQASFVYTICFFEKIQLHYHLTVIRAAF